MDHLQTILGKPVTDPEEEAFVVFSQHGPSHQSLGFIDSKAAAIELSVAGRDLTIHHSRGLLTSDRKQGTTGAVVWKVTPLFADWIASSNFLSAAGYLSTETVALELGAGVAGIVALTLAPSISRYIATDQHYVLRILKQNISDNLPNNATTSAKRASSRTKRSQPLNQPNLPCIETFEWDWEWDASSLPPLLHQGRDTANVGVDLVITCDTVYNDALIEPLNNTCANICRLRSADPHRRPTLCLVAQQLRSPEVFESWLKSFHSLFHVWRVPDKLLTPPLRENSGFTVHVGILR
ncbi:uncharacterized protein EI97DRAFT_419981 [Westerdykella ornata]|uniref:Diaminohydroxyphosphoribosylamino-pyrimidine deaminase n=1 Tax=Westerdykella ornata TaxID=318751 RepID=A0A6A6JHF4_WESOR|nr:uncharacterized protein EI97DRAFT_419981 [Westerdykella ornata]KAF2275634.1 hypothetical protein EI97DRAFT_419981 [Westerdykella ornata]